MDALPGPSNISDVGIFRTDINKPVRDASYYTNLEPDFRWNKTNVKYLIYLVSIHFDEFYDKTLKKKVLWKKIAEEMRAAGFECTSDDCDKKWRNIKKSYIGVLQKQVQGDFSSKFPYFDQMHAFLGKEIDPLGMREQGLNKAIQEKALPSSVEFPRVPYYEVTEDDNFEWTEAAVHMLLDLILEHREPFRVNPDIDSVWESIADKMGANGYSATPEQCQRKWVNLSEGFRHFQGEAEVTGVHPTWVFFARVRHVINTLNVPITVVKDANPSLSNVKVSLTTPIGLRDLPRRRKRRRDEPPPQPHAGRHRGRGAAAGNRHETPSSDDDEEEEDLEDEEDDPAAASEADAATRREFSAALRHLQNSLKAEERLVHLEARAEAARKAKAAARHSNNTLALILAELRRINRTFAAAQRKEEEEEDERGLLLNGTPIVDEAACRQAILNMQGLSNFQFVKAPKVELAGAGGASAAQPGAEAGAAAAGGPGEGIIIVEGL